MKFLVLLICLFSINFSHAQYINTSERDAQEIKKRILLVALPEENKNLLARMDPEKEVSMLFYKDEVLAERQAFKQAIVEHWSFNDSIVYTSIKESKTLMKTFPEKYAVLKIGEVSQDKGYINDNNPIESVIGWRRTANLFQYESNKRYNIWMIGISTLVIDLPKRAIEVYLPKVSPSEGDYIFGLNQMQYVLSKCLNSKEITANKLFAENTINSDQLKQKILLLDRSELKCSESEIRSLYPYPFRIVNYDVIENALKTKDKGCAILQNSRYEETNTTFVICNAADGTIYRHFTLPTYSYGDEDPTHLTIMVYYPAIGIEQVQQFAKNN